MSGLAMSVPTIDKVSCATSLLKREKLGDKHVKHKLTGIFAVFTLVGASLAAPLQAMASAPGNTTDDRVIFQSFSLFQPYEQSMYQTLAKKSAELKADGFTDIWMPPGYRSFRMARYMEGYAVSDRYDLGEFPQGPENVNGVDADPIATKYGTADQLKALVNIFHQNGMSVEEDLVPNQFLGLNDEQAVLVNRTNSSGDLWHATGQPQIKNHVYLAYTEGGGPGQAKYGLFKKWDASNFNGTSLQKQGLARAMLSYPDLGAASSEYADPSSSDYLTVTGSGANAKLNDRRRVTDGWYKFDAKADLASGAMNLVKSAIPGDTDTYYLAADGWYQESDSSGWVPYLINSTSFQQWLSSATNWEQFFSSARPTTVNAAAIATAVLKSGVGLADAVKAYMATQPGYNIDSEQPTYSNDNSGIDAWDQFLFVNRNGAPTSKGLKANFSNGDEMLVGADADNADSAVQQETQHWVKWLLDTYHFDGFRIDAASNMSTSVLKQTAETVAGAPTNPGSSGKLSYIESYSGNQSGYESSIGNPQLSYDVGLWGGSRSSLGAAPGRRSPLRNLAGYGYVNRTNISASTATTPNWSFVSNHDQQKNIINQIMLDELGIKHGDNNPSFEGAWSEKAQKAALHTYYDDVQSTTKKYEPYNVPAQYAYMLTSIDTVPTIYYGDLYRSGSDYMSEKTPYYDIVMKILKARTQLAIGAQKVLSFKSNTSSVAGNDLIASVRAGDDRFNGSATVIGSDANLDTSITVPLGAAHSNEWYHDVSGVHGQKVQTDESGNLTVGVSGSSTATVNGYLGVWAPDSSLPDIGPAVISGNGTHVKLAFGKYGQIKTLNGAKLTSVKSSNAKIVSVSKSGKYRALRNGAAKITGTAVAPNGAKKTFSTWVTTYGTGVIMPTLQKYYVVGHHPPTITPKYSSAAVKSLKVISFNKKYLKVSGHGHVLTKRAGTTYVKVTFTLTNKHKVTTRIKYVIHAKAKLNLTKTSIGLKRKHVVAIKVASKGTVGHIKSRKYSGYSKKIVFVSKAGKVKALKKGTTRVTVSVVMADGQKASAKVRINVK